VANNLAAFNAEVWSSRLVAKINQVNVMLPLVNRNWEGDLSQSKTAKVRTLGNISMSNYSTGGTISYQDLAPTVESFTVSDAKYFAFNVDDVDKAQTDINALDAYIGRAVVTINNTIEAKLAGAYTSAAVTLGSPSPGTGAVLTPVITAGAVSSITITAGGTGYTTAPVIQIVGGDGNGATATCTVSAGVINAVTVVTGGNNYTIAPSVVLTTATGVTLDATTGASSIYQQFINARTILGKQGVPPTPGSRWAVIDPDTTALIMTDTAHFIRASNLGDNVVQTAMVGGGAVDMVARQMPGFIGQVAGFNVFESITSRSAGPTSSCCSAPTTPSPTRRRSSRWRPCGSRPRSPTPSAACCCTTPSSPPRTRSVSSR
jgi:hypothetical protein